MCLLVILAVIGWTPNAPFLPVACPKGVPFLHLFWQTHAVRRQKGGALGARTGQKGGKKGAMWGHMLKLRGKIGQKGYKKRAALWGTHRAKRVQKMCKMEAKEGKRRQKGGVDGAVIDHDAWYRTRYSCFQPMRRDKCVTIWWISEIFKTWFQDNS